MEMTGSKELSRVERETTIYTDNTNKRSFNHFAMSDFSELKTCSRKMSQFTHCNPNCFCLLKKIINIDATFPEKYNTSIESSYRSERVKFESRVFEYKPDGVCIIVKIVADVVHRSSQSWLHVLNELAWTVMNA